MQFCHAKKYTNSAEQHAACSGSNRVVIGRVNLSIAKACVILFSIAFAVRLSIVFFSDGQTIGPDETGYHNIAVNLARGNGLSLKRETPFEKTFFREPGYPFFLASTYSVVNIFHPVQYIQNYDINTYSVENVHPEMMSARIVQAAMNAGSVVLVFLILSAITRVNMAFSTGLLSALFIQLAYYSVFILRESLVMFLLLVMNWFYLKYLYNNRRLLWLCLMGVTTGALLLTFQVHIILLPVFFVMTLIHSKQWWRSVRDASILSIVALTFITPHCINAYRHYPDIKVFKTFGTSLTHELSAYTGAIRKARYYGLSVTEAGEPDILPALWNSSSREQFEKSFNGYYLGQAAKLNALTNEGFLSQRKLSQFASFARASLFHFKVGHYRGGRPFIEDVGGMVGYPIVLIAGLVGILGLLGSLLFGHKYVVYLLPFVAYALFFWVLGSECRRMIILQPFLIFFAVILLTAIYERVQSLRTIYKYRGDKQITSSMPTR